ncbi:hypothetical protein AVEN_222977-1 [Araneus ventricosus]|uniref:Uncharacterized protein n=1 Tax=Araneus ventricosus TaxID=182803 RepID=A0A4Y2UAR5_ARAVE|nr:hypothetical protein AVEN_222977-1 [Araneus ventricosus]
MDKASDFESEDSGSGVLSVADDVSISAFHSRICVKQILPPDCRWPNGLRRLTSESEKAEFRVLSRTEKLAHFREIPDYWYFIKSAFIHIVEPNKLRVVCRVVPSQDDLTDSIRRLQVHGPVG